MRGRFFIFGPGGEAEGANKQGGGKCAAEEEGSHAHGEKIAQNGGQGLGDRDWGLGTETFARTWENERHL